MLIDILWPSCQEPRGRVAPDSELPRWPALCFPLGSARWNDHAILDGTPDLCGPVNGDFTQDSGGVLDIDLYDSSQYGQLNISGNAALGGTLDLTLLPGFQVHDLERFTIMSFNSHTGDFANLNLPKYWEEILTTNSLTLEYQTPEPATWVVLAAGLMGLGWLRRRTNFLG